MGVTNGQFSNCMTRIENLLSDHTTRLNSLEKRKGNGKDVPVFYDAHGIVRRVDTVISEDIPKGDE